MNDKNQSTSGTVDLAPDAPSDVPCLGYGCVSSGNQAICMSLGRPYCVAFSVNMRST